DLSGALASSSNKAHSPARANGNNEPAAALADTCTGASRQPSELAKQAWGALGKQCRGHPLTELLRRLARLGGRCLADQFAAGGISDQSGQLHAAVLAEDGISRDRHTTAAVQVAVHRPLGLHAASRRRMVERRQ